MKMPKARMDELAEKLGILQAEDEEVPAVPPNDKQKKNRKKVLRKPDNLKLATHGIALRELVLNPPHGKKDNFEKITVTLPSPIRRLLLNEAHRRKTERDPNWSISVIVREALAAHLGSQPRDLRQQDEGEGDL